MKYWPAQKTKAPPGGRHRPRSNHLPLHRRCGGVCQAVPGVTVKILKHPEYRKFLIPACRDCRESPLQLLQSLGRVVNAAHCADLGRHRVRISDVPQPRIDLDRTTPARFADAWAPWDRSMTKILEWPLEGYRRFLTWREILAHREDKRDDVVVPFRQKEPNDPFTKEIRQ
jgi:hypothetical protein